MQIRKSSATEDHPANGVVLLELRVITQTRKTSCVELLLDELWENKDLRAVILDLFATKASQMLAASITEE